MRCPYCRQNIIVQGRFCPKCGEQVFGRTVRQPADVDRPGPPPPAAPESATGSDIIDIDLEESAAWVPAEAEIAGKTCPYCRFPIKPGEEVRACPECRVPHHAECWRENGGCTTYGCRASPQAAALRPTVPGPVGRYLARPLVAGAQEILEAEMDGQATNALIFSVLQTIFCCGILSIITLSWGLSIISQMNKLGLGRSPARSKAIAAVVISGVVMLIALGWVLVVLTGGDW